MSQRININDAFAIIQRHCDDARIDDWSDDDGEDVRAILTHDHALWIQNRDAVAEWRIQLIGYIEDREVGIFGAIDPGDVIMTTLDPYAAIQMFIIRATMAALNERISALAESKYYAGLESEVDAPPPPPLDPKPYREWLRAELATVNSKPAKILVESVRVSFDDDVPQETRDAFLEDLRALVARSGSKADE